MSSIDQYATHSELAFASYANLRLGNNEAADFLTIGTDMPQSLAEYLASRYRVIDIHADSANGAYAVVFEDKATAVRTLAIRGTNELLDVLSDADLLLAVPSNLNLQYRSLAPKVNAWLSAGVIGASTTVTGHSLGGYLATAFKSSAPASFGAVYTYNAPGLGTALGSITQFFQSLFELPALTSNVFDVRGTRGLSFIAGLGQHWGVPVPIEIESASNVGLGNHSISRVNQPLAALRMLAQLDPALTLERGNLMLVAASHQIETTVEKLVSAVYGLLNGSSTPTLTGDDQALYQRIVGLQNSPLAGKVQIEAIHPATATIAHQDFAALLSLTTGATFSLRTLDAAAVESALRSAHAATYTDWLADQQALATGALAETLNFTGSYLNDRAAFLNWRNLANTADQVFVNNPLAPADRTYEYHWKEIGSVQDNTLLVSRSQGPGTAPAQIIAFGGDVADALTGNANPKLGDRLYGGGGNDTINGLAGDDYLEGNADDDNLQGGEGNDTLLGGAGLDTLDGGKGIDTLKGGQGNDTYILRAETSDVTDTIIDSDGSGSIKVYGSDGSETVLTMSGGKKLADGSNIWQSLDQRFTFTLIAESGAANTLRIDGAGVKVLVKNFTSGDLDIDLPGAAAVPANPTTSLTILGDLEPANDPLQQDELGNVITTEVAAPGRNDILFDSTGDDKIDAGGGADLVTGSRGGNDWIRSADGDDVVFEYGGDDLIELGAGRDIGYGGAGKDRIYGHTAVGFDVVLGQTVAAPASERDIVDGGAGDDTVAGYASADALFGAGGKDVLVGGAGDDNMFGDLATSKTLYGIPDVQRVLTYDAQGNVVGRSVVFTALEHELPQDQDADLMLGGAGADMLLGDGGDDYLDGGVDNDYLAGGVGSDALLGAEGDDELDGDGTPIGVASLGYVAPELHGSDFLDGGAGDDKLMGGGGDDELFGSDGVDRLYGDNSSLEASFMGDDYLDGGAGTDTLVGEGGDDQLVGGSDDDVLSGDATDLAGSSHGKDYLDGGNGADILLGDGDEDALFGGAQNDIMWGDSDVLAAEYHGNDYLDGEEGEDQLVGNGGNDQLFGGADDDELFGDDDILAEALHGNDYLDGEEGNDYLRGYGGNDVLVGGAGDDTLIGEAGNDAFEGGTGWDLYLGGAGDDTYIFNAGDTNGLALAEFVDDSEGVNHIKLNGMGIDGIELWPTTDAEIDLIQSGNEAIFVRGLRTGAIGSIEVNGTTYSAAQFFGKTYAWPVEINTSTADSALQGGKASDTLMATGGNSTLAGGLGSDVLSGSGGGNTYLYDAGDGHDSITDTSSPDQAGTLNFGAGVAAQDIRLSHAGGDLVLTIAQDPTGSVRIAGFDAGNAMNATGVNRFAFADGTALSHAELVARGFDIQGGDGSDLLQGTNLADRLTGKAGNDILSGRAGDDVYTFNVGDGADTIADADTGLGANDVLVLGDYISPSLVHVGRQGDDLLMDLSDLGGSDQITLRDYFGGGVDAVEHIRFADGTIWTPADVLGLLSSGTNGNDTIIGSPGDDLLSGGRGNDALSGLSGNDTLSGGTGADTSDGGTGDDVYLFSPGDGSDTVLDAGGIDVLRLGTGISPLDATILDNGKDLILRIGAAGDQITLRDYLASSPNAALIETIEFQDGTTWMLEDVLGRRLSGTSGDDVLTGFDRDDSIDALAGNDLVYGRAGADTLRGGEGNDQLFGEAGNDIYVVYPQEGSDVLSEAGGGLVADADKLLFAAGLVQADFTFAQEGMDLLVTSTSKGVALRVVNQFAVLDNSNGVETIEFSDGAVLDRAALRRLLSAPTAGDDTYIGDDTVETIDALAGNDTVSARGGNDVLRGNIGADLLYGGTGDDIYDYRPGDGSDVIDDQDPVTGGGGIDTLQLGAGISPTAVTLVRSGDNLIVNTGAAGDSVTISGYYSRGDFERITFSDGTTWNQEDIAAKLPINGTAGADTLIGTAAADLIDGGAGQDTIWGGPGDDTLRGGTDTSKTYYEEKLYGEDGDDVLISGNKPAWLYGGAGNDILIVALGGSTDAYSYGLKGGDGNDLLVGSAYKNDLWFNQTGNNIIIGGKGDDSYVTENFAPGQSLPLGRNLLLYNTGDGAEMDPNGEWRYASTNDIVSIGLTNYSQFALSGGVGADEVGLASGRDRIPEAHYDPVPESNDTKYVQFIVSARDYDAASTDPLRNRKVVVIDIEAWGREFYATVTDNRNYDLLAGLRRHIAWSSDTDALGGKIAYEYGTKGNIDAVSLQERRAIMADPNLNLLAQPIDGQQMTALSLDPEGTPMIAAAGAVLSQANDEPAAQDQASKEVSRRFLAPAPDFRFEAGAALRHPSPISIGRVPHNASARPFSDVAELGTSQRMEVAPAASNNVFSAGVLETEAPAGAVQKSTPFAISGGVDALADRATAYSDGISNFSAATVPAVSESGATSVAGLWAQVDAWSQLEQAFGSVAMSTGDSTCWELPHLQPHAAAGFVSTTPEISRLGIVERIERVASLGIADLSA